MVVLRVVSGVAGLLLLGYIFIDIAHEQQGPPEPLTFEKGTYPLPGELEPPLSEETRADIRSRGMEAASW